MEKTVILTPKEYVDDLAKIIKGVYASANEAEATLKMAIQATKIFLTDECGMPEDEADKKSKQFYCEKSTLEEINEVRQIADNLFDMVSAEAKKSFPETVMKKRFAKSVYAYSNDFGETPFLQLRERIEQGKGDEQEDSEMAELMEKYFFAPVGERYDDVLRKTDFNWAVTACVMRMLETLADLAMQADNAKNKIMQKYPDVFGQNQENATKSGDFVK